MNDAPYKVLWKVSDESDAHVHYEQYTNRELAEQRLKELQGAWPHVTGVIYCPEDELPVR